MRLSNSRTSGPFLNATQPSPLEDRDPDFYSKIRLSFGLACLCQTITSITFASWMLQGEAKRLKQSTYSEENIADHCSTTCKNNVNGRWTIFTYEMSQHMNAIVQLQQIITRYLV